MFATMWCRVAAFILIVEVSLWGFCVVDTEKRARRLAPTTGPEIILGLYQLLKDTDTLLTEHHIPYFITGGTLLGAVRHQGIIPWDDDVDIGILDTHQQSFIALIPHFKALGYHVIPEMFGYRIIKPYRPWAVWKLWGKTYYFRMTCLDVFTYTQRKHQLVGFLPIWPKDYFDEGEVYPLTRYRFGQLSVLGPKQAVPYLNRLYGEEWNTVAYRQVSHRTDPKDAIRVVLTEAHRHPAEPQGPLK